MTFFSLLKASSPNQFLDRNETTEFCARLRLDAMQKHDEVAGSNVVEFQAIA